MVRFPKWAPPELVSIYSKVIDAEVQFSSQKHRNAELKAFAKDQGFGSWPEMQKRNALLREILCRLLSRTEMQNIWAQIGKVELIDPYGTEPRTPQWWAYRYTAGAVDRWFQKPKLTKTERTEALKKISRMARELSLHLQPFELGGERLADVRGLMGNQRDNLIRKVLHPDIVLRMDRDGNRGPGPGLGRSLVADLVPTLPEMLTRLADSADDDNSGSLVTKMKAATAFRSHMIQEMAFFFYRFGIFSPDSVAKFVAVALDEPSVTSDLVRKLCRKITAELSA